MGNSSTSGLRLLGGSHLLRHKALFDEGAASLLFCCSSLLELAWINSNRTNLTRLGRVESLVEGLTFLWLSHEVEFSLICQVLKLHMNEGHLFVGQRVRLFIDQILESIQLVIDCKLQVEHIVILIPDWVDGLKIAGEEGIIQKWVISLINLKLKHCTYDFEQVFDALVVIALYF